MARNDYDVIEEYTGTGALAVYTFDFKIESKDQLLVVVNDNTGLNVEKVRGTDLVYLSSVVFDSVNGGGTVTLAASLPLNYKMKLLLANDEPTQTHRFKNLSDFTLKRIEAALDFLAGPVQRLAYLVGRSVKLPDEAADFNLELPTDLADNPNSLIMINPDGDGLTLSPPITGFAGDFTETIDANDYSGTPELSDYDAATNKIIFSGTGITDIKSILAGSAGQRLVICNETGAAINMVNEDAGETAGNRVSTGTGSDINFPSEACLFFNYDGNSNTWRVVGGSGGAGVILGTPTDGDYGGAIGPIAGIEMGDSVEDALDKVDTILGLLAPEPPEALVSKTLSIPSSYTAREAVTGTAHTDVTDDTTPIITPGQSQVLADSFRNGNSGTLSCEIDTVETGSIALTSGDDTGSNGELQILFDFDPYLGQFGKEGFWKGIVARINSAVLTVASHTASLIHTETGQSDLTFYVDDPTTPSITPVSSAITGTAYKSGVPYANATVNVKFDVDDFCGSHYNNSKIAAASSSQTNTVNDALGGPYSSGDTFNADIDLTVQSSEYTESLTISQRAYNSKDTQTAVNLNTSIRIDTNGTESRLLSSTGQYPAAGYGTAFNSTTDVLSGNKELQFLDGQYQYPPLVSYAAKVPVGPDYSALTADAHNSMRWATFSLGALSAATSITFNFSNTSNFGGSTIISGMEIYVRVDGASPTTGWVDANAAYPGVGNPTNDGDPALDVGASSVTSKRVTFGAATKTGTAYVRIGIPSGSTKAFGGVS